MSFRKRNRSRQTNRNAPNRMEQQLIPSTFSAMDVRTYQLLMTSITEQQRNATLLAPYQVDLNTTFGVGGPDGTPPKFRNLPGFPSTAKVDFPRIIVKEYVPDGTRRYGKSDGLRLCDFIATLFHRIRDSQPDALNDIFDRSVYSCKIGGIQGDYSLLVWRIEDEVWAGWYRPHDTYPSLLDWTDICKSTIDDAGKWTCVWGASRALTKKALESLWAEMPYDLTSADYSAADATAAADEKLKDDLDPVAARCLDVATRCGAAMLPAQHFVGGRCDSMRIVSERAEDEEREKEMERKMGGEGGEKKTERKMYGVVDWRLIKREGRRNKMARQDDDTCYVQ